MSFHANLDGNFYSFLLGWGGLGGGGGGVWRGAGLSVLQKVPKKNKEKIKKQAPYGIHVHMFKAELK